MRFNLKQFAFHALLGAFFLAVYPSSGFGEALLNTFFGLPPGLANDVVRVGAFKNDGTVEVGTGTIIAIRPDGSGMGNFYCILTADHVVRDARQVGMSF